MWLIFWAASRCKPASYSISKACSRCPECVQQHESQPVRLISSDRCRLTFPPVRRRLSRASGRCQRQAAGAGWSKQIKKWIKNKWLRWWRTILEANHCVSAGAASVKRGIDNNKPLVCDSLTCGRIMRLLERSRSAPPGSRAVPNTEVKPGPLWAFSSAAQPEMNSFTFTLTPESPINQDACFWTEQHLHHQV